MVKLSIICIPKMRCNNLNQLEHNFDLESKLVVWRRSGDRVSILNVITIVINMDT